MTRRLLAVGYQGFENVGDEAILTGIESILGDGRATVSAIVCGPVPGSVVGFPGARRISSPRLLPTGPALRALWASDGLLLSGGGLIHDHWPSVIPRYLFWIVLARALGKRVAWLGVGVGPISRGWQRVLARLALRLTTIALVRDAASTELLGGVGGRLEIVPDPAIFNPRPDPDSRGKRTDGLAIIIRGPAPVQRDQAHRWATQVVEVCAEAPALGWRPTLLTMAGPTDGAFVDLVRRLGAERDASLEIASLDSTPEAAIGRLATFGAVISMRLHGLLLAALAGVACVPVAYDAKVRAAAIELGIGDLVVEPAALTAQVLLDRLAVAADPACRRRVEERVTRLRDRREAVADRIVAGLGQRR